MLRSVPFLTVLDCLSKSINQTMSFMNYTIASRRALRLLQGSLAAGLILLLLAIAPFAVAQDVHHELAAADHDGHEHSDTDLCQWLQHHTAGSLDVGAPLLTAQKLVDLLELPADSVLLSFELSTPGPSRAPPCK